LGEGWGMRLPSIVADRRTVLRSAVMQNHTARSTRDKAGSRKSEDEESARHTTKTIASPWVSLVVLPEARRSVIWKFDLGQTSPTRFPLRKSTMNHSMRIRE
jgi:hypothetical protein